jgi:hypothetical protein
VQKFDRDYVIAALAAPRQFLASLDGNRDQNARRRWLWHLGAPAFELSDLKEDLGAEPATVLLEIAALCAEAGAHEKAISLGRAAVQKDKRALQRLRYMGLTQCLGWLAPDLVTEFSAEMPLIRHFIDSRGTTAHLLADRSKSVCVVGNSPCLLGLKRGREIDSHDFVMRFNNFETLGYEQDTGRRTDIWVRGRQRSDWRYDGRKPLSMIVAGPPTFWRMKNGQNFAADCKLANLSVEEVETRTYYGAVKQIGSPPSSGLLMVWWLICLRGSLDGVTLVGFEPAGQSDGLKHYFPRPRRVTSVPHDWGCEQEVLSSWIKRYGAGSHLSGFGNSSANAGVWRKLKNAACMSRLFQAKP